MIKNKRIKPSLVFLMILVTCVMLTKNKANAEEQDPLGFTYENVHPKNQISDRDYFELKVNPGDKQTLVTKVTNNSDKTKTIQVTVSDATTSSTGVINYGASKEKLIGEEPLAISEMIEAPTQIKVKPGETEEIKFKLTVPRAKFDGLVLGGIRLKEITKESTEPIKDGASLQNEYSYIYSISIKENDKKIEPEITSSGAKYSQKAYVSINNVRPMIASKVKAETLLMGEDSDKVLKEFKVSDYRIAPNSTLALPLEGTDDLELGKYRTKTTVFIDDKKWDFENKFEVTKENKEKKQDVLFEETPKEKTINWLVIILIVVSFIATTAGIFFIISKSQKKKKDT
ncbi:DUF916 domain-containing protein [Vagococcus sp.]|uniref:DUF916 domain-containing protein n=1 Tax=Vagococcus sp. TaxID=1933889 RepID=UPI002FCAFB39